MGANKSYVNKKFTLKTDSIYIGDICYALDDEVYDKIWGDKLGFADGLIKVDGEVAAVTAGTAYGDGLYFSDDAREFPVDAGNIGIVNLNYSNGTSREKLERLGAVIDIPNGECTVKFYAENGIFDISVFEEDEDYNVEHIFRTHINTEENEEEEDYYEEDEEEYYDDDDDYEDDDDY